MKVEKEAQYLHKDNRFTLTPNSTAVYVLKTKNPKGWVIVEKETDPVYPMELLSRDIVYLV